MTEHEEGIIQDQPRRPICSQENGRKTFFTHIETEQEGAREEASQAQPSQKTCVFMDGSGANDHQRDELYTESRRELADAMVECARPKHKAEHARKMHSDTVASLESAIQDFQHKLYAEQSKAQDNFHDMNIASDKYGHVSGAVELRGMMLLLSEVRDEVTSCVKDTKKCRNRMQIEQAMYLKEKARTGRLRAERDKADSENQVMRKLLQCAEQENRQLKFDIDKSQAEIFSLTEKLKHTHGDDGFVEHVSMDSLQLKAALADAQQRCTGLEQELLQTRQDLSRVISETQAESRRMHEQLADTHTARSQLELELKQSKSEVAQLQGQMEVLCLEWSAHMDALVATLDTQLARCGKAADKLRGSCDIAQVKSELAKSQELQKLSRVNEVQLARMLRETRQVLADSVQEIAYIRGSLEQDSACLSLAMTDCASTPATVVRTKRRGSEDAARHACTRCYSTGHGVLSCSPDLWNKGSTPGWVSPVSVPGGVDSSCDGNITSPSPEQASWPRGGSTTPRDELVTASVSPIGFSGKSASCMAGRRITAVVRGNPNACTSPCSVRTRIRLRGQTAGRRTGNSVMNSPGDHRALIQCRLACSLSHAETLISPL